MRQISAKKLAEWKKEKLDKLEEDEKKMREHYERVMSRDYQMNHPF